MKNSSYPMRLMPSLLLLVVFSSYTFAQNAVDKQAAQAELSKIFAAETKFMSETLNSDAYWRMKFTTENQVVNSSNGKYEVITQNVELIAGKTFRITKYGNTEIYADSVDIISVDKKNREILRTGCIPGMLSIRDGNYTRLLQDSLFKTMTFNGKRKYKLQNRMVRQFDLTASNNNFPYKKVTIIAFADSDQISKIVAEINPGYQKDILSSSMTILERNKLSTAPIQLPVYKMFFESSGRLKQAYSTYELTDLKSSKK